MSIELRKAEHLRICLEKEVEAGDPGFSRIKLVPAAFPELDWEEVDTSTEFLGKKLKCPFIIEGMSGGVEEAKGLNRDLASVAEEMGIGFGVGSQRAALENEELVATYWVRDVAPTALLLANLGAVQLNYGYGAEECERAVEMIDADALVLHVNSLQEVFQPEGTRGFRGLVEKVNAVAKELKFPVVVKFINSFVSRSVAEKLEVAAIDISGCGGTSWALVEGYRSKWIHLGKVFADWGIPLVDCLLELRNTRQKLIASGGVRNGLQAAKALALGADCVGFALPLLKAWASRGKEGVRELLLSYAEQLRVAMFLTGSKKLGDLKGKFRL